jgi:RNA polymerase sigma-70 factor, ECF subfamily
VAAEADSVQVLQICQDVTIGEGDSQLIKPTELAEVQFCETFLYCQASFVSKSGFKRLNCKNQKLELKEIIKYCRSGSQLAFNSLFDKYYQLLYHVSKRILINHHDVEDVIIQSFTKIFKNINKVEYINDQSFVKWMKTIAINESIRFINSKKQLEFIEDVKAIEIDEDSLLNELELDIDIVYKIINQLPDGYRIVFTLFAIEGFNHKDISQMLNITESTSKSQLRKARIRIVNQLKDFENGHK